MNTLTFYEDFAERVDKLLESIHTFLTDRVHKGRTIAGYGAAAKATVLLNAADVGPDVIGFVVDSTPYKVGRFIPGVRIPIYETHRLLSEMPDDVLILAWNFAAEIMAKETEYRSRGGSFLIPIPRPTVVDTQG
jgi:hypothetical protein